MGRMVVWVVIAVLLIGGAVWLSRNADFEKQDRIEVSVTPGNAS